MEIFYSGNLPDLTVEWTITKGNTGVREDFRNGAEAWAFLVNSKSEEIFRPITGVTVGGAVVFSLPDSLEAGIYGLKLIWVKNGIEETRLSGALARDKRSVSEVNDAFAVTNDADGASSQSSALKLIVKSQIASYGYDGLSAYELSVLRGKTSLTEDEWLEQLNGKDVLTYAAPVITELTYGSTGLTGGVISLASLKAMQIQSGTQSGTKTLTFAYPEEEGSETIALSELAITLSDAVDGVTLDAAMGAITYPAATDEARKLCDVNVKLTKHGQTSETKTVGVWQDVRPSLKFTQQPEDPNASGNSAAQFTYHASATAGEVKLVSISATKEDGTADDNEEAYQITASNVTMGEGTVTVRIPQTKCKRLITLSIKAENVDDPVSATITQEAPCLVITNNPAESTNLPPSITDTNNIIIYLDTYGIVGDITVQGRAGSGESTELFDSFTVNEESGLSVLVKCRSNKTSAARIAFVYIKGENTEEVKYKVEQNKAYYYVSSSSIGCASDGTFSGDANKITITKCGDFTIGADSIKIYDGTGEEMTDGWCRVSLGEWSNNKAELTVTCDKNSVMESKRTATIKVGSSLDSNTENVAVSQNGLKYYIGAASFEALEDGSVDTSTWYSNTGDVTTALADKIVTVEALGLKIPIGYALSITYNDGVGDNTVSSTDETSVPCMHTDDAYNYYAVNAPGSLTIKSITVTQN